MCRSRCSLQVPPSVILRKGFIPVSDRIGAALFFGGYAEFFMTFLSPFVRDSLPVSCFRVLFRDYFLFFNIFLSRLSLKRSSSWIPFRYGHFLGFFTDIGSDRIHLSLIASVEFGCPFPLWKYCFSSSISSISISIISI